MVRHALRGRIAAAHLIALLLGGTCRAQISAYASGTYGYQTNPLYNYEQAGDQVRMAYLELAFSAGGFRGRYAGGMTVFNRLTERNFLDHTLLFTLAFRPAVAQGAAPADSAEEGDADEKDEQEPPVTTDSLGTFGEFSAKFGGRHDKAVFREFDNGAADLGGSVRWGFEGWHLRLVADGGYRVYPFTKELSNASAVLIAEAGLGTAEGFSTGLCSLVGIKHYTVAAFDSARFEPVRTYVTVTKPGSGKGGAKITVRQGSGKEVLANADVRTVGHYTASGFAGFGWATGSLRAEILYGLNLSTSARILARTPEAATINDDLYNDFFSYTGPGANLSLQQTLPLSVRIDVTVRHQRKRFGAPAFDLAGVEIAGARVDRYTGVEMYASRYFPLSSDFGLDIALTGGVVRNESNDAFNDCSGWSVGFSLGCGF